MVLKVKIITMESIWDEKEKQLMAIRAFTATKVMIVSVSINLTDPDAKKRPRNYVNSLQQGGPYKEGANMLYLLCYVSYI